MGWFGRKKGVEVVDLTEMRKRGLLRRRREKDEVVELGSVKPSASSGASGASALGFLDSLASANAASSGSQGSGYGSYSDKLKSLRSSRLAEFNSMKVKLEDFEYKIERLIERLEKIEARLLEIGG